MNPRVLPFSSDLPGDEAFMQRAIDLASLGAAWVSPNPMVGCVIVHNNTIIGEGYHERYGEAHAEPNAIKSVKDQRLLQEATLYVTLEPCAHQGKTPPCADLIVKHQLKRVVIGAMDSNPLVAGKGLSRIRKSGIEVTTGVLEDKIRWQNRRFFTRIEKNRPYILLKWAQTTDGFIARTNFDSKWISSVLSRQLVHRWRTEEDAIMVGTHTAHHDNPQLNARDWYGKDPIRVVVDRHLRLSPGLNLFDGSQQTLVYNHKRDGITGKTQWIKVDDSFHLKSLLADLQQKGVQSLLVEGGAALLESFIRQGLWDEARVFTGTGSFGLGIPAPRMPVIPQGRMVIDTDILETYYQHD
ncbi:diaminohydroxyphosphoribosylaminopyrimidine deaminase [Cyclobacterium lianum]|uniref:Riboflavin biosynthesis protein RibD n=1 Tax=Cyclobacterium lianum TaxID=388280 RepID=A0A1M7I1G4_9BACT|nr:bifunctional diaminohydroxyphosphoribosylaminopyrimidine deaminase/5-amino-6-(5-phosphoribosylamino)uracil reductase RibD [Cyclobacterium lianum]SHM34237.1 diaminohydroxyphosphoribosylaminopyrimidine deaminase [Cyclobacterium lianum]